MLSIPENIKIFVLLQLLENMIFHTKYYFLLLQRYENLNLAMLFQTERNTLYMILKVNSINPLRIRFLFGIQPWPRQNTKRIVLSVLINNNILETSVLLSLNVRCNISLVPSILLFEYLIRHIDHSNE